MPHLPVEDRRMEQQWESSVVSALRWCQCHRWIIAGHLLTTWDGVLQKRLMETHTDTHLYKYEYLCISGLKQTAAENVLVQFWFPPTELNLCEQQKTAWSLIFRSGSHGYVLQCQGDKWNVWKQVREVDTKSYVRSFAIGNLSLQLLGLCPTIVTLPPQIKSFPCLTHTCRCTHTRTEQHTRKE